MCIRNWRGALLLGGFIIGLSPGILAIASAQVPPAPKVEPKVEPKAEAKPAAVPMTPTTPISPIATLESTPAEIEKADLALLSQAKIDNTGPALLAFIQARIVPDGERIKIQSLVRQMGDESFEMREQASKLLEQLGLIAVGPLRQATNDADPEVNRRAQRCLEQLGALPSSNVVAAVVRRLGLVKPPGTAALMLAYLPDADDDALTEELRTTLSQVAVVNGKPDAIVMRALEDPLPIRRTSAIEALIRSKQPDVLPQMKKLAQSEVDPVARLRMLLPLVTIVRDREAVPQVISLLGDLPQEQGWRAEELLLRLAGDDGPRESLDRNPESRQRSRDAWKAWWDKNQSKIDLAKLDERPVMLGLTLVLTMERNNAVGRAYELGPDGKEKWAIKDLQFPISAQLIPGDRIVIAEHNRHFVSERDLNGTIRWQQQILMPVSVQVLPNGNLFVAARNQLIEFERDRSKRVYSHQRPQHDVVAAMKARNGEIIVLSNNGQLIRMDSNGQTIKSFALEGRANYYSGIQLLANQRVLITLQNAVAEIDLDTGKQMWSAAIQSPSSVQRLPNGNTLVASMILPKVVELDSVGKQVWEHTPPDGSRPWKASRR